MSANKSEEVDQNVNPSMPDTEQSNYLQYLLDNPLKLDNFVPLTRRKIYETDDDDNEDEI